MYTENEILEHLTEGEGRGFLGRSMYDAIFDKIHALITENQQLKEDNEILRENYLRAIKLLKENRKLKEDIKAYEQERNNLINSIPFKENKKLKTNWNELKKYIDNNKMILNNPHIFQYYLIQEEILKGDSND